jgi:hypothetical protein
MIGRGTADIILKDAVEINGKLNVEERFKQHTTLLVILQVGYVTCWKFNSKGTYRSTSS